MIGTRRIEWIGGKSIFADPLFQFRKISGQISEQEMRILRSTASKRFYRVDGSTQRVMGAWNDRLGVRDPPLSREYRWGPHAGDYVQRVTPEDWEIIRASRNAKEFRDVTDGIPEESPIVLPGEIEVVQEQHFHSVKELIRAEQADSR